MVRAHSLLAGSAAALALTVGGAAGAQEFPDRPIEMTMLFGSASQTLGHLLAELMSDHLGEKVVPVARTGGGGSVGYQHVQSSPADGYHIVWNSNSINTNYHSGAIDFDYTAFDPIARVSSEVATVAVRADSGWESLADMAGAIEARGRPLRVGASGRGSFTHLATEAMLENLELSDQAIHVPFDEGRAPVEVLAGRIDAALQSPGQFVSHHEAGTLRILCVTGAEPIAMLPEVPSCAESGAEGFEMSLWRGLAAPAGTPDEVLEVLEDAARAAVEDERFQQAARTIGVEPDFAPREEFGEQIAKDDEMFGALMTNLGLTQQ